LLVLVLVLVLVELVLGQWWWCQWMRSVLLLCC
jgi:hypothetical protein